MIKPTYEIICYEPGLRSEVIGLQSLLWSPSAALNAAHFEWKYKRNPYVDTPLIYLAMHDGKAVGMRGFFGMQWEGGMPAQKSVAVYADDLVIVPEHRNRGIIRKIMAAAFEDLAARGYRYALNLSAGPMNYLTSLTTGWRSVGSMQPMYRRSWRVALRSGRNRLMTRLVKPPKGAKKVLHKGSQRKQWSFSSIGAKRIKLILSGNPRLAFEQGPRSAAMSELIERIGSSGRIRQVRDRQYFDWRFQNPLSHYRFLYWAEPQLEGYLVLQEYTSAYAEKEVVNIVDWEASSVEVEAALLQAAVSLIDDRRMIVWSVSLPAQSITLLLEAGFKPAPEPQSAVQQPSALLVRPIRKEDLESDWIFAGRRLLDMKNWDLRMLYSMHG